MLDRQPTKPGRIKLTDDNGNTQYYYMERADEPIEEGTPINKNTLFNSKNSLRYSCNLPSEAFEKISNEWIVSIPSTSWSSDVDAEGWYTVEVAVENMKEVYNPLATLIISSAQLCNDEQSAWSAVKEIITKDGAIVCKALDKIDITLNIKLSGV